MGFSRQLSIGPCHAGPMPYRATRDGQVMVESSEKMWYAGGGNDKPFQFFFFATRTPWTVWKGKHAMLRDQCIKVSLLWWVVYWKWHKNMGVSEIKFFRHLLRGWTFWNISWRGWCPTFIPYLANERTNARMKCTDWNNTCLLPCLSPDWVISSLEVSQAYWKSCLSKVQPYSSV